MKLHTALSIGELFNANSVVSKALKAAVALLILSLKASNPFTVFDEWPRLAALAAFFVDRRTILRFFAF